jgi:DNA-binding NarL/FixJ family response regulator
MMRTEKIRVMVVDDHPMVRLGVSAIVNAQEDMTVVAQAETGQDAVELFAHHVPDLTLMDLRLPGMSGVQAIRAIRARNPVARFVVLTTYDGDEDIHQAIAAGARGYLLKGMSHDVLIDAIRRVHAGERYIPPRIAHTLAERRPNCDLSPREQSVLAMIVQGKSNREIATELGISEATVKCHVTAILGRLGVEDRTQAAVAAIQRGIVHLW